jgi:anti-sigma factor RsiW
MNESQTSLDLQLSRLVDGELSPSEYRALLQSLDTDPQGWRKCALAFLEAQAMSGELSALRGEYLAPSAKPVPASSRSGASWWGTLLAMAASFVVALPLGGWLLGQHDSPRESSPTIAQQIEPSPEVPQTPITPSVAPTAPPMDAPLGKVRLVTADAQVEVPYYSAASGSQHLLTQHPVPSDEVLQSLERQGHLVKEAQAGVMPVQLQNGAQLYLPIESYLITPASHRLIQ